MLGSHNSLSSYPCAWYIKPFNIFSKCQSKTLEEQLENGVRFFDIRIKMKPNGKYAIAHGLALYKTKDISSIMKILSDYGDKNEKIIFVRILLEYNKAPKDVNKIIIKLKELYYNMVPHLWVSMCGVYSKWDNKQIVAPESDNIIYNPTITHKYSSCIGWKRFIYCIPYLYAKKHNKEFKKSYKDILDSETNVLLLDFV